MTPRLTLLATCALAATLAACQASVPLDQQTGAPPPAQDIGPPPNLTTLAMPTPDAVSRTPLVGTTWRLATFRDSSNVNTTPTASQVYTLQFKADGTVAMQLYCNRGMGGWSTADANAPRGIITFGQLASSMAACPPSPFDRMAGDFSLPVKYTISGGKLFLMPTDDGGIYTWIPQAPPRRTTRR